VLDVTPPSVSVTAAPGSFTPTAQGVKESMTLTVDAKSNVAKIDSWTMNVLDPAGKLFKGFSMKWPVDKVTWDGKGLSGDFVQPGQTYTGTLIVRDEYGNVGRSEVDISVAALPEAPQPKGAGPSSVTARRAGFAPTGALATIGLSLSFAQQASVKTWKVEIAQTGQNAQKTLTGTGSNLPATLTWDGKTDAGSLAPEGTYTATLSIDYGTAFKAESVSSAPFVLDLTPPNGSISLSPDLFSPIEATDTLTITLTASSRIAKIDSWTLDIYDPGGHLFESFDGKWPASEIIWDGRGINGDMVVSSEDYPVSVQIRDEFGNVGILKGNIPIDILVVETPQGYRIPNSRVWFKAYTPDYEDVSPDLAAQNDDRLDQLAAKLKKFPDYKYRIVGHAVMIHWDDPARGKIEQEEELIPLSKARAEAIKQALIERGVDGSAITTEGVGASDQIVPDSDLANRWQNRRTAIFIEKE
jgi:flagellar motor protein MotB/flagellar hook assembly protein FlgD